MAENERTTILIRDGVVLTADGWLDPGFVWIEGAVIADIGPGGPPHDLVSRAGKVLDAARCAVIPGLVNGHTHLSQTFMRGLAGGRGLLPWLRDVVWPIQATISPEELHLAATLGLVENLRCGVTEVVDHHKITRTRTHTDAVLKAAAASGLRVTVARAWSDLGKTPEPADAILADLKDRLSAWPGGPARRHRTVDVANGPLALWRCSAQTLAATHELAMEHGTFTHLHAGESRDEVRMSVEKYDVRPVQWLSDLGLLDPATDIVHAVWVDDDELAAIGQTGARVVHCPVSNAVLGSGVAPLAKMVDRNIDLRLGTDGPASNDTQDIFETLKAAVMLARATTHDPTVVPPATALAMATGGRTLSPHAAADIAVVNLDNARAMPVHDPTSALVLSTHGTEVNSVIVDGRLLLEHGHVLALDELSLLETCRSAAASLLRRIA